MQGAFDSNMKSVDLRTIYGYGQATLFLPTGIDWKVLDMVRHRINIPLRTAIWVPLARVVRSAQLSLPSGTLPREETSWMWLVNEDR